MKSGVSRKVKMGASVVAALTLGAVSVVTPNATPQAHANPAPKSSKTVTPPGNGRISCRLSIYGYSRSSVVYTSSGCSAQARVYCSNGYFYVGYSGNPSRASCPYGTYAVRAYGRVVYPYVSYWYY
jgi:hypothetical protein